MTVTADKAIKFKCEKCGEYKYGDYTLEPGWEDEPDERAVMVDTIDCGKCGHPNRVIMEM